MNAELPPFKNGKHNSKSVSTLNRDLTPFTLRNIEFIWVFNTPYTEGFVILIRRQYKQ